MEHPAELSRPYVWKTTALVAAAIAAFELALLVVVVLALIGNPFVGEAPRRAAQPAVAGKRAAAPAGPKKKQAAPPKLPRERTSVIVLNGNGLQGAAGATASRVQALRYIVAGTANAPRTDFARSLVMFRPGYRAEAERLARDLRIRRVAPLDGLRPADLQGAHVALIVGAA